MFDSEHPNLPWHNPYNKPFLALLINDNDTSSTKSMRENVINNELNHNLIEENLGIFLFQELFTHTINPIISLGLIMPIQVILTVSAIFIQIRTLQMLKHEKSVNNRLMVTQARIHIMFWPSIVIIITLADNIYPLMSLTTPAGCTILSFFFYFCLFSMILYTFYAALIRYLCTVRTDKVNKFGKDSVIRLIYWTFYLHTTAWAVYTIFTSFNSDHIPLINSCYGHSDEVFLMEYSSLKMIQRHFCGHGMDEGE